MLILLYFLLITVNTVEKCIVFDLYISIIQLMNCKYNEIDYAEKSKLKGNGDATLNKFLNFNRIKTESIIMNC